MASHSFQTGHAGSSSNGLSLNLSSNNPFRNRAASPASLDVALGNKPASPVSPFDDPPPRPLSRNPFLDQPPPPLKSPGAMSTQSDSKSLSAEEIFNSLTLDEKPGDKSRPPPGGQRRPMDRQPPRRGENVPPPDRRPQQQRRPRRNSESSLMDFDAQPLTEEEKKMIEQARRLKARQQQQQQQQQQQGRRDGKEGKEGRETRDREPSEKKEVREGREGREGKKPGRPSRRMDIIDKLDATSIYGTGVFHHDGPFDALNPHRNRGSSRRAPMQAFPKDSLNNSLGGAGPLNAQADHSTFMGMATDEAFRDYAIGKSNGYKPKAGEIFDSSSRGEMVHGDESHGLGTSTFLEGTPAARSAIVRHRQEQAQEEIANGGLQRKKSLAQRIRHINKGSGSREFSPSGRITNPEAGYYNRRSPESGGESNPFFSEFGKGEENISVRPRDGGTTPNGPPVAPRRGSAGNTLERRATSEGLTEEGGSKPSGLLGRMKSLKGGRKPRTDGMRDAPPYPGQAV